MDELMAIEKHIGEVAGIISLQFNYENEVIKEEDIAYEQFQEKPEEEAPEQVEVPEGEEEPVPEEEAEKKEDKNAFKVEDYTWTAMNRIARNLP